MRTRQRDTERLVTIAGGFADAASGRGYSNGVDYVWTRTATGLYVFQFDTRLYPVSVIAQPGNSTLEAGIDAQNPGVFRIAIGTSAGVLTNNAFTFTVTLRDGRY